MTPNGSRGAAGRTDRIAEDEALEQAWLWLSWAAGGQEGEAGAQDEGEAQCEARDDD